MSNHDDAAFVRNFSLVLGGLCVVGLTAFVLAKVVNHLYSTTSDASTAAMRTAPAGTINIGAEPLTMATPLSSAAPAATADAAPAASSGDLGKDTYDGACFACHAQGIAGAPKIGDAVAWEPRLAQGRDTLISHALNGYTGTSGVMPARGGNPTLSDDAIKAAVDYLIAAAKGEAAPAAAPAVAAPVTEAPPAAAPAAAVEPAAVEPAAPAAAVAVAETAPPAASGKGKETYDAVCFVCHTAGVAGAPKFGDPAAWGPRIAKGLDVLHGSAINGFMGTAGMMPPKGGRPDISDDDIKAAVDYMVSAAK